MTDKNALDTEQTDDMPTELQLLKQRADMMGITYSNNIGVDALRKKVTDKMEGTVDTVGDPGPVPTPVTGDAAKPDDIPDVDPVDTEALLAQAEKPKKTPTLRNYLLAEATKLIRIRISCMDPKKQDLPGEFFTVANEYIGTVRKLVPFGEKTDGGFHVPACILEMLRTREFLSITTHTHPVTKVISTKTRYVKEFAIEVLPPLTRAEIEQLARDQIATGRLEDRD